MGLVNLLWLCVWSGMFSDLGRINSPQMFNSVFGFIQGIRAFMPLFACLVGILILLGSRSGFSLKKNTLGFLFIYSLIGVFSSFFMSPDRSLAFYWAGFYLSPILVILIAQQNIEPLKALRSIIRISYFIVFLLFISFIPQTVSMARGRVPYTQFFDLPFDLGQVRVNGVGRYALVVGVVAFVRLNFAKKKAKVFWVFFAGMALLMMAYTRSRTTLIGLGVVSLLFAYIQKLDWRFFFAGPAAAYVLWVSGYKWRAQQNVEKLLNLTGREYTWQRGVEQVARSPIFGWGFHADRLLLNNEHMHNSYLHAAIHSGILGALFFFAAVASVWVLMVKRGLLKKLKYIQTEDKTLLFESVLIVGYLTSRSFFESTAAFYGVDLLVYVPAATFIILWLHEHPDLDQRESREKVPDVVQQ